MTAMDVVEFLRARLDEDEAAAKAWLPFGNPNAEQRQHVASHDPARVLADVESKRGVVAKCEAALRGQTRPGEELMKTLAVLVLEGLATAYADHSDFREEWRP
jgi:hypothetical protein